MYTTIYLSNLSIKIGVSCCLGHVNCIQSKKGKIPPNSIKAGCKLGKTTNSLREVHS